MEYTCETLAVLENSGMRELRKDTLPTGHVKVKATFKKKIHAGIDEEKRKDRLCLPAQ